jgi:hypothetical protein
VTDGCVGDHALCDLRKLHYRIFHCNTRSPSHSITIYMSTHPAQMAKVLKLWLGTQERRSEIVQTWLGVAATQADTCDDRRARFALLVSADGPTIVDDDSDVWYAVVLRDCANELNTVRGDKNVLNVIGSVEVQALFKGFTHMLEVYVDLQRMFNGGVT